MLSANRDDLARVAATGFGHRLASYKIVGHTIDKIKFILARLISHKTLARG